MTDGALEKNFLDTQSSLSNKTMQALALLAQMHEGGGDAATLKA
jgi:hypothetical protein